MDKANGADKVNKASCGALMSGAEVRPIKGRDGFGFILGVTLLWPLIWQIWWFRQGTLDRPPAAGPLPWLPPGLDFTDCHGDIGRSLPVHSNKALRKIIRP